MTHTGSQVKSRDQWPAQREYLKAMLAHYQYGHMPPRPKKITVKQAAPRELLGGKATQIDFVITVHRAGKSADLRCALVRPKRAGKFPVIIKYGFRLLAKPESKRYAKNYTNDQAGIAQALSRGYIVCKFLRSDIATDTPGRRTEGVIGLYPEYDCGAIAAWAWGYQIVIDALGAMEFVDIEKVVATGHSRGGKSALCAAIYDERIAIAAPNSSGTGGTGSMKYFEPGQRPQRIAMHAKPFSHWWPKRFLQFAGKENKLPFDAHFAKALIAPRGLINTHATEDYWANPYGTQLTHQAAKVVFDWLGAGDRIGIHWRPGGHAQTIEDWRALLDFSDAIFFKKKTARKFDVMHYKTAKPQINWKAPQAKAIPQTKVAALRRAITDLSKTFGSRYPKGSEYLKRLDAVKGPEAFDALKREALLSNPLLNFDKLLVVKRRPNKNGKPGNPDLARGWDIGFPRSSFGKSSLKPNTLEGEIAVLSPVTPNGKLTTLYRPAKPLFVGDVDLHFDASRMLFTKRDARGNFQIHEISAKGGLPRQVSRGAQIDVHNHDACYLPNNDIVFASTACFQGVPCNKSKVALLYRMDVAGKNVRQLCFDQDHNFHPSIQEDGRVMYLRWEYSDLPHTYSRIMFQMNPDGTGQMALYGASSYWPNGIYSARGIPGKATMFTGIVAGHHDCYRTGELIVFDVARGRHEADGVVQRIPGYGKKVQPLIEDKLTSKTWPKFAHPYPLSDKYYLTTCKLDAKAPWDIYLVDVFDNMLRLHHADRWGLFEPIPFRTTRRPPVIPDKVDLKRTDATVMLADIYRGKGLAGVPRGTIKRLRLVTLHYCYQGLGGQYDRVGLDGPWDVKQVLGTVPVESDGSASFRIPANMPIAIQPLDAEGKAVQLMRSWLVGMPGEVVSCVGCHEQGNMSSAVKQTIALRREPSKIKPFYGPKRGFSFNREIQPVLDKYCLACHNGKKRTDGRTIPDLRLAKETKYRAGHFTPSYMAIRRLVRTPTMEPDMHMLATGDFHADTTELVQMLTKGHHNVKLSNEAWERLITWIDIQAPAHGTWRAIAGDKRVLHQAGRRRELLKLYTGRDDNPEPIAEAPAIRIAPVVPAPEDKTPPKKMICEGWPFDAAGAIAKQKALAQTRRTINLGKGLKLELMHIPGGKFVMGAAPVAIAKPFWIGRLEVSNKQYAAFDPSHDSRMEPGDALHFEAPARGFALNSPNQPVARVSWNRAVAFCKWLSKQSGQKVRLPTEAQWEWACRAGTNTPMWYGQCDANFAIRANLADATFKNIINYGGYDKAGNVVPPWRPAVGKFDDKHRVSSPVGTFKPNPWGLHDMHGNVAEWTNDLYQPNAPERRVARGGSWYDRPKRATSAFRTAYKPWLRVYNVGFRVVVED